MALTLEQASELAARAHAGQVDKIGRPYVEHVFAVRDLLAGHGEHARIAGVLHDVLEDTDLTADDLRAHGCPEEVVRAVLAVSRRPDETYDDLIARAAADPLGRLVKLADNAHNSDEARLAALPAEQAARLRAKYARARAVLEGAEVRTTLVVVYTPRLEECRAFYEGLGLRFVRERHGSGPEHHAATLAGGLVLELYPATEKRLTGGLRLGLTVPGHRTDPPSEPGRYTFTDPDGRPVDVLVE
ncbi:VOC family protein [Nocardiopsis lambiniae]|uniref:HD domain-containing protein n=1 Tax=Nocardiopsis lambiniae TaxID=3075539 RepID=A0ABU2MBM4_9ACTN|nr:HD domain-containing protein [Nocardiopsis sp. DSM 44743]MDT0329651.1 HD domain-containing protein [Nocardiopsis sp. DSM 44743]